MCDFNKILGTDGIIRLASGDESGNIAFWNLATRTFIYAISQAHNAQILCLRWLGPGTSFLASVASGENQVKIWEMKKFRFLKTLADGNGDMITSMEVLSNGALVTGSTDANIKLWDINTVQSKSYDLQRQVNDLKELPNGKLAVLTIDDDTILTFDFDSEQSSLFSISASSVTLFGAAVIKQNVMAFSDSSSLYFFDFNEELTPPVPTSPYTLKSLVYSPIGILLSSL